MDVDVDTWVLCDKKLCDTYPEYTQHIIKILHGSSGGKANHLTSIELTFTIT